MIKLWRRQHLNSLSNLGGILMSKDNNLEQPISYLLKVILTLVAVISFKNNKYSLFK